MYKIYLENYIQCKIYLKYEIDRERSRERNAMKGFSVSKKQAEEVSLIFKSFSHPSRLMMLCKLSDGPCTVQQLQDTCDLEQAQTSQFLARLRKEGRDTGERDGNQVYYSLTDTRLVELMKTLGRLYCKPKE